MLDTGDRPYMCVLCRDTFSRSDILKRHFQKCSIRRGNPTGVSHLSHPHAHVKKNNQNQKNAGMGPEGDLNQLNGLSNMPQDGMSHPFGMVPVSDGMNSMANDQNQLSRSSSISRLDNGNGADRRSMTGQVPMGPSQPYGGGEVPGQQMPNYSMPPGQNGMPMYGGSNSNQQSGGLDWSQMFQAGAHQTYTNHTFPPNLGQTQTAIKTEHNYVEPRPTHGASGDSSLYANWEMPSDVHNPYTDLSDQILNFFDPSAHAAAAHLAGMNLYFASDNIKDFLDNYTHFHIHTPVIHIPSFKVMEAYTGLVVAMCCIGACYSDRVEVSNVRKMMDFLWVALERDCKLLSSRGSQVFNPLTTLDTEHFQTLLITAILNLWNGTPEQRERARQAFPILSSQARKLNLQFVSRDASLFSPVHQADFDASQFTIDRFDWDAWVEQERRIRVMLGIYLGDVAMGLFFNRPASIDTFELCVPLPCDDAAWDAITREDCFASLGLLPSFDSNGTVSVETQRVSQPQVKWVMLTLLHSSVQTQPGSTNLYGKFVLIHAIMALIRRAQTDGHNMELLNPGPLPPSDWAVPSKPSDGRVTPVMGAGQGISHANLIALSTALDKFKYNWDMDMLSQFPPTDGARANPKRSGFSRDGIHFYWLAKYILKYTNSSDLQLGPEERLMQVLHLLKSVRTWVMNDGTSRGEELGSIGEIDEHYGTTDLTLDMAKLFTPLPQAVDGIGLASVKAELDTTGG